MHSRALPLILIALLVASPASSDLYVANTTGPSVTVYFPWANGNAAPARRIGGPASGLVAPWGVTADVVNAELIVADFMGKAIRTYPLTADGDVPPIRTLIDGPNSGLGQPRRAVVDTVHNELIVANWTSIRTYKRSASGDVSPIRVISGVNTLLNNPSTLILDAAHDELILTRGGFSSACGVLVFPRTANGNVAPSRFISGPSTNFGMNNLGSVAYDAEEEEYIARIGGLQATPALLAFPRTATGDVPPVRTMKGPATGLTSSGGIHVDLVLDRYVTSEFSGNGPYSVRHYKRLSSGNAPPLAVLTGSLTRLSKPHGLDDD